MIDKQKQPDWWRGIATHMWRTYFTLLLDNADINNLSSPDRKFYTTCHNIFSSKFSPHDQDILRMYFTSPWGDDRTYVSNYAATHNINPKIIWMIIKRANRTAIEELGLLDRKESNNE